MTVCVRNAITGDAEALSAFAAAVFLRGGSRRQSLDLGHYIATELTPKCFRTWIENPDAIMFVRRWKIRYAAT